MKKTWVRIFALALAMLLAFTFLFSGIISIFAGAATAAPETQVPGVGADAYVVMDAATGQVLVEKNADAMRFPASITKIMTLALALEKLDLSAQWDELVTVSQAAVDALIPRATMVALVPGEEVKLLDLFYATQIESANDAANVLGEFVGGSMDHFANLMNEKTRELGLGGTRFVNPSGQPDENHYTTARDMANITRWALEVPRFRDIFVATEYQMEATNRQAAGRSFHTSNMMLQSYSANYCEGITGSKSGYTDDARYTLVTTVRRGDTELICVVLQCPTNSEKYTSTQQLIEYCFANFHRESYSTAGHEPYQVPVYGGGSESLGDIQVLGEGEIDFLLHNSLDITAVEMTFQVPERYVIGEAFEPMAQVSLKGGDTMPDSYLAEVPLVWQGLEELLARHTGAAGGAAGAAEEGRSAGFWAAVLIPAALLAAIFGRIIYVQWRRWRRRMARLAAARAQMPVAIADRPRPVGRQPQPVVETGPAAGMAPRRSGKAAPGLRVVQGRAGTAPRRVGRAR